ncbi:Nuclear envelope morphology protein 1 [Serendipita sp. 411]|nr:Nuclear envelope morphology protein 1 [Serendipita sp. 400]KAG8854832.1 Nuclear envelope morphology protein 1 [Serendipita sp. 411]
MNSLNYLSRQIDVFATSGTPPSTPLNQAHFINSARPPRAKSYSRITPRRPSHQYQHEHQPQPGSNLNENDGHTASGTGSVKKYSNHGSKRSFSSPALWSFRKPTLTPTASIPSTPAATESVTPIPSSSPSNSTVIVDESLANSSSSRPTVIKRQDSYGFGIASHHLTESSKPESAPVTSTRPLVLRVLTALWDAIYALWLSVSGLFVFRSLAAFGARSGDGGDTTGDEKETDEEDEEVDDGIVTLPTGTGISDQQQQQQQYPSPRAMVGVRMQKTLVLDLDETLIHSTSKPLRAHSGGGLFSMGGFGFGFGEKRGRVAGHMVEVVLGGRCTLYHVYKRPFVDYFLRKVSSWYTLVIFTASMQEYADPVIDWLDAGRGILSRRLFRESCTQLPNGSYTKDLSLIDPDLSRVCLIDNSPVSYNVNPANGIPIEGWISDPSDEALLHLLPVLDSLRFATDVRRILGIRLFN